MSFLETPEDYYDYFHQQHISADPPETRWVIGEQAAQLWLDYHKQDGAGIDTLIAFMHKLTPYRYAGSGFYDLWTRVIRYSHVLPVVAQTALWFEIFDPVNHGDRPIASTEQARAIIKRWRDLANRLPGLPIEAADVREMVEMVHPYFVLSHSNEWVMFTYALRVWFEKVAPETPFIDLLIERHNQAVSG